MMPTRDALIAAIKQNPCAYIFEGDQLGYDSGCDCVRGALREGWRPQPVESLDFYLDPQHGWETKLITFVEETKHVQA